MLYLRSESLRIFPYMKMVTPCMRKYFGCNDSGLHISAMDGKEEHHIAVEASDFISQECSS